MEATLARWQCSPPHPTPRSNAPWNHGRTVGVGKYRIKAQLARGAPVTLLRPSLVAELAIKLTRGRRYTSSWTTIWVMDITFHCCLA